MEPLKISASDLIKKSAMQICFIRNKKMQQKVTKQMLRGVEHQLKKSTSQYLEMRGMVKWNEDFLVYFCVDEVLIEGNILLFKEHKNIEGECEQWYINSSILQAAFYHALGLQIDYMCTAKFMRKEYETKYIQNVKQFHIKSVLEMGDNDPIEIYPLDSNRIVEYFKKKAYATLNYEDAKAWDKKNKFQDWSNLKSFIQHSVVGYESISS